MPTQDHAAYKLLEKWCVASCVRRTLTGHDETSLLAIAVPVVVEANKDVVDTGDDRLRTTLGLPPPNQEERTESGSETAGPRMVEQADWSPDPAGTPAPFPVEQLSLIAKAFMEGAVAHKRSAETATLSATSKLSNSQLTQLMGWCDLDPGEQDKLPPIGPSCKWQKIMRTLGLC